MTTIRVRVRTTGGRKATLKVKPGVRVAVARPTTPVKTRPAPIRQGFRFQKDHD